ncbi:MAG: hypothetical protein Q8S33_02355 [Myxococcales bacterium]|nr:hypothetical protein [Myxococcales bacterium]
MTIRTSSLNQLFRFRMNPPPGADGRLDRNTVLTPAALEAHLTKHRLDLGPEGIAAMRAVYREASVSGPPTYKSFRAIVDAAERQLANERGPGRVNDGFIDQREGGSVRSQAARALYGYLSEYEPVDPRTTSGKSAGEAQLDRAQRALDGAVTEAFRRFASEPNPTWPKLAGALRQAAASRNLPRAAIDTLLIAANGATPRGSGGSMGVPTAAMVKSALERARTSLLEADGARIVNFAQPARAPVSNRDGVVTELEVERTPSVRGKAALTLLEYASGLA